MTLAEIQALRRDEPREFDALVAEKVFSYKKVNGETCEAYRKSKGVIHDADWHLDNLDGIMVGWWLNTGAFIAGVRNDLPQFSTDPAADLEAHRAACAWERGDDKARDSYLNILDRLWGDRAIDRGFDEDLGLALVAHYEVGDYAEAALAVKEVEDG